MRLLGEAPMWAILIILAQIGASQPGGPEDFELCKGRQDRSLEELDAACSRVIDDKLLDHASLAEAYRIRAIRADDAGRAIGYLDQAIALNPNNSTYYSDRGIRYGEKRDYNRAFADYDKALSVDPGDAYVYGARALTLFQKGDFARALADIDRAISMEPKEVIFPKLRGDIHVGQGDTQAAIADYDRAIEVDPKNLDAYRETAQIYHKRGDIEAEVGVLNRLINVAPADQYALFLRALAYEKLRKLDLAMKDYDALVALYPSNQFYNERRDELRKAKTGGGAPPVAPVVVDEKSAQGVAKKEVDCRVFVPGANLTVVVPCAK
jgi:tetratricopeptide (TPR) repeat protein